MSNNEICFIIATNNEASFEECKLYINNLNIPKNFKIHILKIRNAKSLTSAYNKGMMMSRAKYKIYLHQDVFITNKSFIEDFLSIFKRDSKIGLIGVCGAKNIPDSGIWWDSKRLYGKVYQSSTGKMDLLKFKEVAGCYEEVLFVDGLIMITQYDVPWRQDLFDGWHFYDGSQCMEFIKKDYKVVVPKQSNSWCMHDCGIVSLDGFEKYRKIFVENYKQYFKRGNKKG